MKAIGCPNLFEEQPIACHRIVNPGSGKNQAVVATKGRNHDRCCHAHGTGPAENGIHHGDGDAIMRRVLDFRERQHSDVREIGQQIQNDHDPAASQQRAHKVLSRVAHFAANERDICPCGLREQRADH